MNDKQVKLPMIDEHQANSCCADEQPSANFENPVTAHWVTGQIETAAGLVCRITTTLDRRDLFGAFKARWGVGRMNYAIPPGLYAIGEPDHTSPVLVSANYKLSFDHLRRELSEHSLWLLVLDTKGINVWCAAGKGSFGTDELVSRIETEGLAKLVTHRTLILPQLAAPGVAAHKVRQRCGFKVIYGPVRASDIPAFLKAGNKAETGMRRPRFALPDRLVLAPVELNALSKPLVGLTALLFLLNLAALLIQGNPVMLLPLLGRTFSDLVPFFVAMLLGAVAVPVFLPYIPGRALAWKGWVLGLLWAFAYTMLTASGTGVNWLQTAAHFLIIPAITAYMGLNFTGSTTYTSLSGVLKEVKITFPLVIATAGLGFLALVAGYFV